MSGGEGRGSRGIHRTNSAGRHYGDSKAETRKGPYNHDAGAERPNEKLRKLLCDSGTRSDGEACRACEAPCGYGREYLKRMREEGIPEGGIVIERQDIHLGAGLLEDE
jgi:hypothetical protein